MILEKGDMWSVYKETDCFLITTNSFVKNDGSLVMGKGIAEETKDKFPGIEFSFAHELEYHGSAYGIISNDKFPKVFAFQVKINWYDNADLFLIKYSVKKLRKASLKRKELRFDLNFPGIGNGGLDRDLVLPIIEVLPDNVHVWEL